MELGEDEDEPCEGLEGSDQEELDDEELQVEVVEVEVGVEVVVGDGAS